MASSTLLSSCLESQLMMSCIVSFVISPELSFLKISRIWFSEIFSIWIPSRFSALGFLLKMLRLLLVRLGFLLLWFRMFRCILSRVFVLPVFGLVCSFPLGV
jgi:hypothetical protein